MRSWRMTSRGSRIAGWFPCNCRSRVRKRIRKRKTATGHRPFRCLYPEERTAMSENGNQPPKDALYRRAPSGFELRAEEEGDGESMPTLYGYAIRFDEWTEIDSVFEGRFMERISPGAARKSLEEHPEVKI